MLYYRTREIENKYTWKEIKFQIIIIPVKAE